MTNFIPPPSPYSACGALSPALSKNIWHFSQYKVRRIAEGFKPWGVPEEMVYYILLANGVFKALAIRRDLIRLKEEWKKEIRALHEEIRKYPKGSVERKVIAERLRTLTQCRQQVRQILKSERLRAPDNDRTAQRFLKKLEMERELIW